MPVTTERMQKLREMLDKQPNDVFLLYALALEHKKLGEFPQALEHLKRVLDNDPNYYVAYQQAGQVHELNSDPESARKAYQTGIEVATRKGDNHARQEMEAALMMVE